MKSTRMLVLASVILLMGFGVSVTLRAWGQTNVGASSAHPQADNVPGFFSTGQMGLGFQRGTDPEMDKLLQEEAAAERQVAKLIESYSRAEKDADRSKIKSELEAALGKELEAQHKRRDLELTRVEDRVKKIRELMKKRSDARQSIINKRLDQLISEAEGLGWTPPPGISLLQPRGTSTNAPARSELLNPPKQEE